MNKQVKQVTDFNNAFNLPMNLEAPQKSLVDLGANLLDEELTELWEAVNINNSIFYLLAKSGLLKYYDKGFTEVHSSNMSKLDDNNKPIFREDGKVIKSKNYFKPNLKEILCIK